jgi:hypothetical protein
MIVAVLWRLGEGRGQGIENEKLKIRLSAESTEIRADWRVERKERARLKN